MKIGIDIRELQAGASTGIGRYLRAFLRYAEERETEHSFVFYGDRTTHWEGFGAAQMRRLTAVWPLSDHWELPQLLASDRIDVFFSPYYKAPWRCPCPYVVTIHDVMFAHVKERGLLRPLKDALTKTFSAAIAGRAAAVITVSEFSKGDIVRVLGIDARKIEVVMNCVPPGFGPPDPTQRNDTLKRHQLSPGFVLYIGSFKPSKNVGALVEAFAGLDHELRRSHPLVLVGPRNAEYERFSRRWGALAKETGARTLSSIGDAELGALYAACSLCVVPSLYEGFGMPALEAMACAAPVLAARRTSLPEVVGDAGELSEPDTAALRGGMNRLLRNPVRLRELSERGLARAAKFSYITNGEAIFSVLKRCGGFR